MASLQSFAFYFQALQDFRLKRNEELAAEMKAEIQRRVDEISSAGKSSSIVRTTPVLRLRVVDVLARKQPVESDLSEETFLTGMISFWKPDSELVEYLSENSRFKIFGLLANSSRDNEVQFRTTKQTKFLKEEKNSKVETPEAFLRNFTDIGDIVMSENFCPKFQELDVIGIVVEVSEKKSQGQLEKTSAPNFETVYICDTMLNFVAIHFWGGLIQSGFDHSTFLPEVSERTPRRTSGLESKPNVLIFKNLQWRPTSSQGRFNRLNNK